MIVGHERAVGRFEEARRTGSLHHAWLLAGPRGIGKAHFARVAATRLLAAAAGPPVLEPGLATPDDHPAARLMAAGSHPDFRQLEREPNDRGDGLRRNITVKQVRKLGGFFANTSSMSPWRAIIIDSVDDLESEGANALLKMLEEPPANSLFLLVAHAPGRLLPTIRSRCRRLDLQPLDSDAMASVLASQLPDRDEAERHRLVALAGGSVGRALAYAKLDLADLEGEAIALMRQGDPTNARRSKLAQSLTGKAATDRYLAFLQLVPALIAREARTMTGRRQARALDAYTQAREASTLAVRLSFDPAATVFQLGSILSAVA